MNTKPARSLREIRIAHAPLAQKLDAVAAVLAAIKAAHADEMAPACWQQISTALDALAAATLAAPAAAIATKDTPTALRVAQSIATRLAVDHFPAAKEFEPFCDLLGVLHQIDNMTCGMTRATKRQRAKLEQRRREENNRFVKTGKPTRYDKIMSSL